MGTIRRTTYRIECHTNDNACVNSNVRGLHVYGADKLPASLEVYCRVVEQSELEGGVNRHAALNRGFLLSIHSAKVIRQRDNAVMMEYKAAPFRAF